MIAFTTVAARTLEFIPKYGTIVASRLSFLISKISRLAYPAYVASCGAYYTASGAYSLSTSLKTPVKDVADKVNRLSPARDFLRIYGGFTLATGICGVLEALNSFGVINYGKFTNIVYALGSITFLYANLAALEENIRVFQVLQKTEVADHPNAHERLSMQKSSAIWGILSNMGYIVATACLLLGASSGMAFVFGVIGAFSSGFKMLYDFVIAYQKKTN